MNIYKAQPRLGIFRRRGYLFYLKYAVALYKYRFCGRMISTSTVEKMDILKILCRCLGIGTYVFIKP